MHRRSIVPKLPFVAAAASMVLAISCAGRGSGTGQPYYGPGTGPIASFLPGGLNGFNTPEFLYALNSVRNDIAIFAIDSQTGCISPIISDNLTTGPRPISIQGHPDLKKRFMYVGCQASGDILAYRVAPDGLMTTLPASGANVTQQGVFVQMRFRGDGKFLYVLTNQVFNTGQTVSTGAITAFEVNPVTGALTAPLNPTGSPIQTTIQLAAPAAGLTTTSLAVDFDNKFAYCLLSDNRCVIVALADSGGLSLVQQTATGVNSINVSSSPNFIATYLKFAYLSSNNASELLFMEPKSGQIPAPTQTYNTGGTRPIGIHIPNSGGALYSVNGQSNSISKFTLSSTNGVLGPAPVPPTTSAKIDPATGQLTGGTRLRAMALSGAGNFAFTKDEGNPPMPLIPQVISCYQTSGQKLTEAPASSAVGPTGKPFKNAVAHNQGSWGEQTLLCPDSIIVYRVN